MSERLAWFNALSREAAGMQLLACCGSRTWASSVAAARPYADIKALLDAADAVWNELTPSDWLEAFAAHPRLGEGGGHSPDSSRREQSRIMDAGGETLAALVEESRSYEDRFGHVFLISAAGRTAEDVLSALRKRMENEPAAELDLAAEEQRKITRLRLKRMLHV
ncbi:MAG: 2-oxo-4-hydroxy-4-carboxy-5-ureidoimidazoline decarboxylase [Candidatus Dormibacteraeota bacterium]|nr:2-oxo-4-hydroxy-4-carboxy-5-ureidoimidazoline decarboxylase [Candidatus Dormibacteraeota bacterium]